ncbi:MAG: hypothetical protein EBT64_07000 [Gammaproteobacteria bacterium]|nr:hypothetical protein [Gammaproteobacteria bacterium]
MESGSLPRLIAGFVVLEAVVLTWLWRVRGLGIAPRAILGNLLSGACLMLAVGASLANAPWWDVAILLVLSLIAHVADLVLRWQGRSASQDA